MKIKNATQKVLLTSLLYEKTGQISPDGRPVQQPIRFPLEKLMDAASAAKKLTKGSKTEGPITTFTSNTVELTPAEAAILNDLFDKNKDKWGWGDAETVMELQALFHGADDEEPAEAKPNRKARREAKKASS